MQERNFERLAARFVALAAGGAAQKFAGLIFSSPLSARSPDLCLLWHPGYFKKHRTRIFVKYLLLLPVEFLKYSLRRLRRKDFFSYGLYGNIDKTLLILPSNCGYSTPGGEYETAYVRKTGEDGLFVFGSIGTCGRNEIKRPGAAAGEKLILSLSLFKAGLGAFAKLKEKSLNSILLLLHWWLWVFSLDWLQVFYLKSVLFEIIRKYGLQKIGCIHEMHNYSRSIWRLAQETKIAGCTVQHAAVSTGKRWYFPHEEEIAAGLALPSIMYVYDKKTEELLRPHFSDTVFRLGCSSRYAQWKSADRARGKGLYYLFAGALAGFDNDVLLASVRKLISTGKEPLPLQIRLHPDAILNDYDIRWLRESARKGQIQISDSTLNSDLNNAIVVIGMSTTVLEEALFLGRPVIQITHPDYLEYIDMRGIEGAKVLDYRNFSVQDLFNISAEEADVEAMKKRLGLYEEEVAYRRLFS